jgi:DNA-binding protein HU-beta
VSKLLGFVILFIDAGVSPRLRFWLRSRTQQLGSVKGFFMSKAFISKTLRGSLGISGAAANRAASALLNSIVKELKKSAKFTLPGFGTFTVRKMKARKALNPRTGEPVKVKAGKTVRFKASPVLKKAV